VTDAADIKPAVTGNDMNSTRKPDGKTETHICMNFNCMLLYYCIFQAALLKYVTTYIISLYNPLGGKHQ
jgi:hypothetical protein